MIQADTTLILWVIIWVLFTLLIIDNIYLRRKIFKLYERLLMVNKKDDYVSQGRRMSKEQIDKILKDIH